MTATDSSIHLIDGLQDTLLYGYLNRVRSSPGRWYQTVASGAAAERVKTIVTRMPCPGLDSTSRRALAFSVGIGRSAR